MFRTVGDQLALSIILPSKVAGRPGARRCFLAVRRSSPRPRVFSVRPTAGFDGFGLLARAVNRVAATGRRIQTAGSAVRITLRDPFRAAGKRANGVAQKLWMRSTQGRERHMREVVDHTSEHGIWTAKPTTASPRSTGAAPPFQTDNHALRSHIRSCRGCSPPWPAPRDRTAPSFAHPLRRPVGAVQPLPFR
jgi:hypothetical protein